MSAIVGKKAGGSDSHTPVESPDSLIATSFAKMLLVLGHGEWAGGLDNTRIFLDGTPIGNADGSINFPGVKWEFRPGTQHQTYIQGMPDVQNDIAVGVELKYETPWVKAITNTDLSAVRVRLSWPTLQQQLDNGDVVGYRVEYAIDLAIGGGAYREVLRSAVSGKSTTGYPRSHRIDLPASTEGWQIRVRRITKNTTNTARVADRMLVDAIVEIVDAKLRYPNLALLYIQFDAKQFQNIPTITCKPKMGILRVPSNYDPINRTYSGIWDGTFKWAWTNNPAWVFYDICINEEYGLGQWIKANNLSTSKWELYEIAKYCDQLVPDGRGGTEPRHLCDVYIQGQEDAINVLSDIISIFSGMFYWAGGEIRALADMSRPVDMVYSRANVKDGFQYSSASERTHYSQAMVSYSNPDNRYQDDIEPVVVRSLVRRYGTLNADITAIGCTRRSEAIRRGKWVLYTNEKDRAVSFTVGLEGRIPLPGWVVGVADQLLAGRVLGGRISSAVGRNVTLDRKPDAKPGDRLIVNLPSGVAQARTVQSVNDKVVTVSVAYSELPAAECAWSVDSDDLAVQLYRVVGIKDASTEKEIAYEINAIEYDENKWAKIESGAIIEDRPISVIPPGVQPPPKNIEITSFSAIAQGLAVTTLHVEWDAAESAIAYEAEWRRDNGNWIAAPRTSTRSFDVTGIYAGRYQCRVRAINAAEISSIWANATETALNGKEGNPPMPVGFAATGILFG
ncbi:TPA: host specificity protein J, partial [Yersinia enterocolitica]